MQSRRFLSHLLRRSDPPSIRSHYQLRHTTNLFSAAHLSPPQQQHSWVPSLNISIPGHSSAVDPFSLVAMDLAEMTRSIRSTVSVLQHPVLDNAASHLLSLQGKRLRPLMVILMAHATAMATVASSSCATQAADLSTPAMDRTQTLLPNQLRLAEITELIHAASLLHDDVIDVADTRRGAMSVNSLFGNQLAVLAGDFLLARASVALARLRDCDVVELLSTVIEHLVRGEVIQMKGGLGGLLGGIGDVREDERRQRPVYHEPRTAFDSYIAKTFFKTASLVANSCRAVTMLAGHSKKVADVAYEYGENVGIAFQLIDDLLDMTGEEEMLGKPVLKDLKHGHATAPVLFAMEQFPEIKGMMERRFKGVGDAERAMELVYQADGFSKTKMLATEHVRKAVDAVTGALPPSEYRSALVNLGNFILIRDR